MPHPYIDIYVLTDNRNEETIERFLNDFTNRNEIEDRGDEELMILDDKNRSEEKRYIWKKAETLSKSISFGLSRPNICFTMFLLSKRQNIEWVTLTFTIDNKLVLGVSVYEYQDKEQAFDNYRFADELKNELLGKYGRIEVVGVELDFPLSEEKFQLLKSIQKNQN